MHLKGWKPWQKPGATPEPCASISAWVTQGPNPSPASVPPLLLEELDELELTAVPTPLPPKPELPPSPELPPTPVAPPTPGPVLFVLMPVLALVVEPVVPELLAAPEPVGPAPPTPPMSEPCAQLHAP